MRSVRLIGRDFSARPDQCHPRGGFRLPYPFNTPRSEPLSHSIGAVFLLGVAVVSLIFWWSVA